MCELVYVAEDTGQWWVPLGTVVRLVGFVLFAKYN
jgi:hypothetical protein